MVWVVRPMARDFDQSALVMFARELQAAPERPNITIEVIPYSAGAHSGLLGAFALAEFADAPSVAYLESAAGGYVAEERFLVAGVALAFDTLRSEALPRGASRDLIRKAAEELWT
jgi:Domain of unknown function (DUF5753)